MEKAGNVTDKKHKLYTYLTERSLNENSAFDIFQRFR